MRAPLLLLLDLTRGYVMVAAGAATGAVCRGAARVAPRRGSSTLCTLAFGMYRAWTLYACEYGERACACLAVCPPSALPPLGREPQLATVWHAPRRPWCAAVETAAAARGATRLSVCENPFATGIYLYGAHHPLIFV